MDSYWKNIVNGTNNISSFSKKDLLRAGVDKATVDHPDYVPSNGVIEGIEYFDYKFFGLHKREAEIMDPQHRIFLEEAFKALDDAGYAHRNHNQQIGVYAGCDLNTYLLRHIVPNHEVMRSVSDFQLMLSSDKDYLANRVAYLLDLSGPAVTVQTACSTSLTAVHMACQSIINGECDMAIAGGVSIRPPLDAGYLYIKDMVFSPDGICRPFDAQSNGIVGGNGVGAVVLKLLNDAVRDQDNIYGIIRGSAMNNDGHDKAGYTAPSMRGQAKVIAEAIEIANISAASIGYIETHGTGTKVGDPIEINALTKAFRRHTKESNYCAIGAVKANIGHTSAAAGISGLIKALLVVKHGIIPPLTNFNSINPLIDLAESPFFIPKQSKPWRHPGVKRRAGVSSFGIGGTNVHVIVENYSATYSWIPVKHKNLLCLSAHSEEALRRFSNDLSRYVVDEKSSLEQIARTLHLSRDNYPFRQAFIAEDKMEAASRLTNRDKQFSHATGNAKVIFVFPGNGTQYVNMARELYLTFPSFKENIDKCSARVKELCGIDIVQEMFPQQLDPDNQSLAEATVMHAALFSLEYSLAKLLADFGIHPDAVIGHSFGEYAAACIADIFTLNDALKLVCERGKLMSEAPPGAMLAVVSTIETIRSLATDEISIASINSPTSIVLSGAKEAILCIMSVLDKKGIKYSPVKVDVAYHSSIIAPLAKKLSSITREIKMSSPSVPLVSNLTGEIYSSSTAGEDYWEQQALNTVQFDKGLKQLFVNDDTIFLEVGPGNFFSSLIRRHPAKKLSHVTFSCLPNKNDHTPDHSYFVETLGKIWMKGIKVAWDNLYQSAKPAKVPLPSYPFEKHRAWIEVSPKENSNESSESALIKDKNLLYDLVWKHSDLLEDELNEPNRFEWIIFSSGTDLDIELRASLEQLGCNVSTVVPSDKCRRSEINKFEIDVVDGQSYEWLMDQILHQHNRQYLFVNCFMLNTTQSRSPLAAVEYDLSFGFYPAVFLAKSAGSKAIGVEIRIVTLTEGVSSVIGTEYIQPSKAPIISASKILPEEYSNVKSRVIDITGTTSENNLINIKAFTHQLIRDVQACPDQPLISYRGIRRFVPAFTERPIKKVDPRLRDKGVYLITGGLGGLGLAIAGAITDQCEQPRFILFSRTKLPSRKLWKTIIEANHDQGQINRIKGIIDLEEKGATVDVLSGDVSSTLDVQRLAEYISEADLTLAGVFHAAGVVDHYGIVHQRSLQHYKPVLAPKVMGTLLIESIVDFSSLDFFVVCSSMSTVWYKIKVGQIAYVAANEFLDLFAYSHHQRGHDVVTAINWNDWQEIGMSVSANAKWAKKLNTTIDDDIFQNSVSVAEGKEIFLKAISVRRPRVLVSREDINTATKKYNSILRERFSPKDVSSTNTPLSTNIGKVDLVELLSYIWKEYLAIETIRPDENFFEQGGHSLLAIQIIARIHHELNNYSLLSIESFFNHPTIASLATFLEEKLVFSTQNTPSKDKLIEEGEI